MSKFPIVSVAISFDSKVAITITKASEREFYMKMYSLTTYELKFAEKIGGESNQYIKCKEITQNEAGNRYCLCFFDNGKFRFRTFIRNDNGPIERTALEIKKSEIDVNKILGINDHTMPIQNFPDPYMCACFINDDLLYVDIHYNPTMTHYHFLWEISKGKVRG